MSYTSIVKVYIVVRQELTSERLNMRQLSKGDEPRRIKIELWEDVRDQNTTATEATCSCEGTPQSTLSQPLVEEQPGEWRDGWIDIGDGWIDIGDSEWFRYVQNELEWFTVSCICVVEVRPGDGMINDIHHIQIYHKCIQYVKVHQENWAKYQSGIKKPLWYPVHMYAYVHVHPGRLTWNIIMEAWKIIFLSKWVICRFHVNLPGCIPILLWSEQTLSICLGKPGFGEPSESHEPERHANFPKNGWNWKP